MKLFYYRTAEGNFGDDLNTWLWDRLLPGWRNWSDDAVLVGVGTILQPRLLPGDLRKIVVGSGVGYGVPPDVSADPEMWDIRAVRGPLTARMLNLPPQFAVADPAILLPDLEEFSAVPPHGRTLFVPHHRTATAPEWDSICRGTGITPISPRGDAHEVITEIAGARRVIAESLHAAIVADAFRIPWQAVSIGPAFNEFKWWDWAASLDMMVDIHPFSPFPAIRLIYPSWDRRTDSVTTALRAGTARSAMTRIAAGSYVLSRQSSLDARKEQLRKVLDDIMRDYGRPEG